MPIADPAGRRATQGRCVAWHVTRPMALSPSVKRDNTPHFMSGLFSTGDLQHERRRIDTDVIGRDQTVISVFFHEDLYLPVVSGRAPPFTTLHGRRGAEVHAVSVQASGRPRAGCGLALPPPARAQAAVRRHAVVGVPPGLRDQDSAGVPRPVHSRRASSVIQVRPVTTPRLKATTPARLPVALTAMPARNRIPLTLE